MFNHIYVHIDPQLKVLAIITLIARLLTPINVQILFLV